MSCFCLAFNMNQFKISEIILTGSKTFITKGPLVMNRSQTTEELLKNLNCMPVLITCKFDDDQIKIKHAIARTTFCLL